MVQLLKELAGNSTQWLVTDWKSQWRKRNRWSLLGGGSVWVFLFSAHLVSLGAGSFFVLESLLQAVCCKQLWKLELVSPAGAEGRSVYCVQVNKDNISLQGKVWIGLFPASYKKMGYPKFGVPQLCCRATVCTESTWAGPPTTSGAEGKGN